MRLTRTALPVPPLCVSAWAWARHTERFVPGPFGHGGKKLRERNPVRPFEAREETDHNLSNELSSSVSAEMESLPRACSRGDPGSIPQAINTPKAQLAGLYLYIGT